MGKYGWYIFILILVFLLVVYYKGTSSVGGTLFGGVQGLVGMLQGRGPTGGPVANYPTGG